MIYLDSASTTPVSDVVLNEMLPYLKDIYGNPNSIHTSGIEARKAVDKARELVAEAINASPNQIIFTSGGSEANNLAIKGADVECGVFSKMEHTSSVRAMNCLPFALETGGSIRDFLTECLSVNRVGIPGIAWKMFVNNELGLVSPVYDIGKLLMNQDNLLFGTDCVQALGFEHIDVQEMKCDFLTISSHKIHGPKGVGALYVRDRALISDPLISGGSNQEFGIRGGTENVPGIVGFGKACEIASENRVQNRERILYLKEMFTDLLISHGINFNVNCVDESKILSVMLPGIDAETFVALMSSMGVAISSGSACKNNESEPNEALIAYGLSYEEARSTVRISFMESLTEDDIIKAAEIFSSRVQLVLQC